MADAEDVAKILAAINKFSTENQALLRQVLDAIERNHAVLRNIERNTRSH
ncbi:MAG: hypothetical protein WC370_03120 [Dehalococcoidales bacterium]|jgi:hypothetical protein